MSFPLNNPAFPTTLYWDEKPYGITDGMSLRDYFAAAVLQSMFTFSRLQSWKRDDFSRAAERAYRLADAMLAERKKGGA